MYEYARHGFLGKGISPRLLLLLLLVIIIIIIIIIIMSDEELRLSERNIRHLDNKVDETGQENQQTHA